MSATPATPENTWETVGLTLQPLDRAGATPLHLARRKSDDAFGLVRQIGREWSLHGPAVKLADAMRCAEHVAAGNPRALTWPHAQLTMAVGLLAFEWLNTAPPEYLIPLGAAGLATAAPAGDAPPAAENISGPQPAAPTSEAAE